jgi:hypothetical protein
LTGGRGRGGGEGGRRGLGRPWGRGEGLAGRRGRGAALGGAEGEPEGRGQGGDPREGGGAEGAQVIGEVADGLLLLARGEAGEVVDDDQLAQETIAAVEDHGVVPGEGGEHKEEDAEGQAAAAQQAEAAADEQVAEHEQADEPGADEALAEQGEAGGEVEDPHPGVGAGAPAQAEQQGERGERPVAEQVGVDLPQGVEVGHVRALDEAGDLAAGEVAEDVVIERG